MASITAIEDVWASSRMSSTQKKATVCMMVNRRGATSHSGEGHLAALASASGVVLGAASEAYPDHKFRSLRDASYFTRGRFPGSVAKGLNDLHTSYSFLRHVSPNDVVKLGESIAAAIRASAHSVHPDNEACCDLLSGSSGDSDTLCEFGTDVDKGECEGVNVTSDTIDNVKYNKSETSDTIDKSETSDTVDKEEYNPKPTVASDEKDKNKVKYNKRERERERDQRHH